MTDERTAAVLAAVDPEEVIALTRDLVRINSVWDPAVGTSEQEAAEHCADWARQHGFEVEMDEVAPGRPNAIVTWQAGPGDRTLMYEGHTDVVTPGDPEAWTHDPFGAEILDGRMYGRGTNDTKGNLAAMLSAMAALKRSGVPLAGTIVAGVLCDEEDGMTGVNDFIDRGRADRVTGAVICEPQDGLVCTSQKGAIRARFQIRGHMSHGAMPLAGLNTAPGLARLIDGLVEVEKKALREHGRHPHLGWPSFTPTVIRAPHKGAPQLNVVPGVSELLVDIRTVPSQSHDEIRADLIALTKEVHRAIGEHYQSLDALLGIQRPHEPKVTVEFLTDRPCTETSRDDPLVAAAARATREATGREPEYAGVPGATDGTFLWSRRDIPIVTMGAGDRYVPHQKDEWVSIDQLVETVRIYALIALDYLRT